MTIDNLTYINTPIRYNSALTMMAVGCIFATFNVQNLLMAHLHSCLCVFLELAAMTVMAPSGMPYCTLPFCLSTMFAMVFALRQKQETERVMNLYTVSVNEIHFFCILSIFRVNGSGIWQTKWWKINFLRSPMM